MRVELAAWMAAMMMAACLLSACSTRGPRPTGPQPDPRTPPYVGPTGFSGWRALNEDDVAAFEAYLRLEGVDTLIPVPRLLRTASWWKECRAAPFEVPPQNQWPSVVEVLKLMRTLQEQGVLGEFEVHSTYRNPVLNACVGGAPQSAHARAWALDFTPRKSPEVGARLCAFWRDQGPAWRMGLGRYPTGRLHVDTFGWRTWGEDGTWQSASCPGAALAARTPQAPRDTD